MGKKVIKLGRREVPYDKFVKAVADSKRYSDVCKALGFNAEVQTTLDNIKNKIKELKLDVSHFTYKYTISKAVDETTKQKTKDYELTEINRLYYNTFMESLSKETYKQYKVHCGDILQQFSSYDVDFAYISIENIEEYVSVQPVSDKTKANCKAHIRSMLIYMVKNNVGDAARKVSKDVLIWLI